MAFKQLIESASNIVGDLSSLSVESYTGTIQTQNDDDNNKMIDWDAITSKGLGDTDAEVQLVMASKFEFDGDAKLFVTSKGVDAKVEAAHNAAVVAGAKVRSEILDFLKDALKVGAD